ncbi:MAG: helix-turn-helix domain-containing protein [bacterium]
MQNKKTGYLTIEELAELLSVNKKTIYKMVKEGSVPFIKVGKQYRFDSQEVIDSMKKGKAPILERMKLMENTYKKRLLFAGFLTNMLKKERIKPIVVGGNAVAFYTAGGYATGDIDIVIGDTKKAEKIMKSIGFKKSGKGYISKELDLFVKFPSGTLAGSMERVVEVEIEEYRVFIIGIEDIIQDRLNAYIHWKSRDDFEWAKQMAVLNKKEIDWKYLKKRSTEEKTAEAFEKLKKEIK